jgi:hypothetical protein
LPPFFFARISLTVSQGSASAGMPCSLAGSLARFMAACAV